MGKEGFSELRRSIEGISQRTLTLTLKELQRDGLISRTAYPAIPPRVQYELTKRGHSLLKLITELGDWARQNRERIQSARDKYDAQKPKICARPSLILAQLLPPEADNPGVISSPVGLVPKNAPAVTNQSLEGSRLSGELPVRRPAARMK